MGTRWRLAALATAVTAILAAGGCIDSPTPVPDPPAPGPAVATPGLAVPRPAPILAPTATPPVPGNGHPVGLRVLHLSRGADRPLVTLIFYPATAGPGAADVRAGRHGGSADTPPGLDLPTGFPATGGRDRGPASGRFPLVLFSHGLSGSPQRYYAMLSGWAAAGFVVVAPVYPHTSEFTTSFRRRDIVNQPADARYVLAKVQRLNATPGDPLRGHLDVDRVAAVGHSAGGYTTLGLFTARHDPRLRAAVVMAGWLPPGVFAGPPATMLFLQGTADPVVPAAISRAAYEQVPWPKAYLLLHRNSHATYLRPGERGYAVMESTVLNFLRWTLKRDQAAGRRLPPTHYPAAAG
jgi:dienelactone hydrolase